jgi:hypothetical protein
MVGRSNETLLTKIQVLVLVRSYLFLDFLGFTGVMVNSGISIFLDFSRFTGVVVTSGIFFQDDFGNLQLCRCSVLQRCL